VLPFVDSHFSIEHLNMFSCPFIVPFVAIVCCFNKLSDFLFTCTLCVQNAIASILRLNTQWKD